MEQKKLSTGQTAQAIGVSRVTLQDWLKRKLIRAPRPVRIGGSLMRLWSKADVRRAKAFVGTLRRGPKGPRP